VPITVHGFRSSFRVWAGEATHYPGDVVEAVLAHTIEGKAEAAYARTDLLERRRPLMEEWAAFCECRTLPSLSE
jgi:integrase